MLAFPSNHYKVLDGLIKAAVLFSAYVKCGNCKGAGCTIYADVLEEYMLGAIKERLF